MIRRVLLFLICFSFATAFPLKAEAKKGSSTVQWTTRFEEAASLAKKTQRPLLLFFTGSDWCGWCTKLEKEILENREFVGSTADKFVFVKLDYPMKKKLDAETTRQNEELQKRFAIRSFPTVVLLDPDQQPIGVTGYRSGGGKQYAAHLIKMVDDFIAYKEQMKRLGAHKFSGKELKRLYQKAEEFGLKRDQSLLVTIGVDSDLPQFFLAERYRQLVSEGKGASQEAQVVKGRLRTVDPDNTHLSHYQIAMIDFGAKNRLEDHTQNNPEEAIAPLLSYIQEFGAKDADHLWRLYLEVYQTYLDSGQIEKAHQYAKLAYESAPSSIRAELIIPLETIEKKIKEQQR